MNHVQYTFCRSESNKNIHGYGLAKDRLGWFGLPWNMDPNKRISQWTKTKNTTTSSVWKKTIGRGLNPQQIRFPPNPKGIKSSHVSHIHPRNLTWNLKIMVSKWTFLFQGLIFRFHVKIRGCNNLGFYHPSPNQKQKTLNTKPYTESDHIQPPTNPPQKKQQKQKGMLTSTSFYSFPQ